MSDMESKTERPASKTAVQRTPRRRWDLKPPRVPQTHGEKKIRIGAGPPSIGRVADAGAVGRLVGGVVLAGLWGRIGRGQAMG